jgi:hypothetical protein
VTDGRKWKLGSKGNANKMEKNKEESKGSEETAAPISYVLTPSVSELFT